MTCPKCALGQRHAGACRRCGLVADRFATWTPPPIPDPPEGLATAWATLESTTWREPARHDAFVALAQLVGRLDYAAACYRSVADRADRPGADAGLARIRTLAAATMVALATPRATGDAAPASPGKKIAAFVALLVVGATLTWALLDSAKHKVGAPPSLRSTPSGL